MISRLAYKVANIILRYFSVFGTFEKASTLEIIALLANLILIFLKTFLTLAFTTRYL